jgi:hypothetical protein
MCTRVANPREQCHYVKPRRERPVYRKSELLEFRSAARAAARKISQATPPESFAGNFTMICYRQERLPALNGYLNDIGEETSLRVNVSSRGRQR